MRNYSIIEEVMRIIRILVNQMIMEMQMVKIIVEKESLKISQQYNTNNLNSYQVYNHRKTF